MPYKIRAQRKKEVDLVQIQSRTEAFIEEALARPALIWGTIALLILLGAGFYSLQYFKRQAEDAAWALEAEASKLFHEPAPLPEPVEEGEAEAPDELLDEQDRLKRAAELYDEVLEKHSGTKAAALALFESGNVHYKLGDYSKAEARYLSFLQKHADQKNIAELAQLRLAYLYAQKGDRPAARTRFQKLYESPGTVTKDQAGFELARVFEAEGQLDKAKALYENISQTYIDSPWGVEAKARLILLNPPKEVDEEESPKSNLPAAEVSKDAQKAESSSEDQVPPEAAQEED